MKAILTGAFAVIVCFVCSEATAQFAMDTARFANPVRVEGAIPGLYKWANSPQSDSADVTILSPTEGQRFKPGDSMFVTVSVSGVAIGAQTQDADLTGLANSAEGQYIGIVLDNDQPLSNYKSGAAFFVGVATAGTHTIRVFASRSWHESIKSRGAFKTVSIVVGDSTTPGFNRDNNPLQPSHPIITWNSPTRGQICKVTQPILLDFIVTNATPETDGYDVRLFVDSASTVLTGKVPYLMTGLTPGVHTIGVEWVSPAGDLPGGEISRLERMITVK